jgi:hypothetical protein
MHKQKNRHLLCLCFAAAFTLAAFSDSANADTVGAVVFSGQVNCSSSIIQTDSPGTFSFPNSNCITATLGYADGDASASITGVSLGGGAYSTGGTLEVQYFFEVVGSISEPVPLILSATGSSSDTGGSFFAGEAAVYASATFETPFGSLSACTESSECGFSPASFSSSVTGNGTPGTIYEIDVAAGGGAGSFFAGSWTASIDPQVMIDPNFADAGDFTLEFSPNPAGFAPEPSSFSLLVLCCFTVLGGGVFVRGRRWCRRNQPNRS